MTKETKNRAAEDVDWQALAKKLQAALESQFDDYEILETKMAESHRRYLTIISYLEKKLGLDSV